MIDFSADHFSLLGLPKRYRIDLDALDAAYRKLQGAIHPDRHAAADDTARRLALQASAKVNEAYTTLKDPAARGEYLLGLQGIVSLSETDTKMPIDFLTEQMERREAIEEATDRGDHAALEQALAGIGNDSRALQDELAEALDDRNALDAAKVVVRKLRFIDRIREEITDALIEAEA